MKKNYSLKIGLVLTVILVIIIIVGQFWTPYEPTKMSPMLKNKPPSIEHLMGTDNFGRDILSRVMSGAGITLFVALTTVILGGFIGSVIGLITGYYGGKLDEIIMRINDALLSFPSILLALILVAVIGPGKYNIIIALSILFIPSFVRIMRSEMLRYKDLDYVKSAKIIGVKDLRLIFVHIFPNTKVSLLTSIVIGFNNAILAESSMSYLSLGVQPPDTSLGRMLSESQSYLLSAPWYSLFPGLCIVLLILGFSLIGEGLRRLDG